MDGVHELAHAWDAVQSGGFLRAKKEEAGGRVGIRCGGGGTLNRCGGTTWTGGPPRCGWTQSTQKKILPNR